MARFSQTFLQGLLQPTYQQGLFEAAKGLGQTPGIMRIQQQQKEEKYETESVYPQCINVKNWAQFIGSNGIYYPCCYMRSEDNRMIEGAGLTPEDLESMSIYNHSVEEILTGPGYRKVMDNFENISVCKEKCAKKS